MVAIVVGIKERERRDSECSVCMLLKQQRGGNALLGAIHPRDDESKQAKSKEEKIGEPFDPALSYETAVFSSFVTALLLVGEGQWLRCCVRIDMIGYNGVVEGLGLLQVEVI